MHLGRLVRLDSLAWLLNLIRNLNNVLRVILARDLHGRCQPGQLLIYGTLEMHRVSKCCYESGSNKTPEVTLGHFSNFAGYEIFMLGTRICVSQNSQFIY